MTTALLHHTSFTTLSQPNSALLLTRQGKLLLSINTTTSFYNILLQTYNRFFARILLLSLSYEIIFRGLHHWSPFLSLPNFVLLLVCSAMQPVILLNRYNFHSITHFLQFTIDFASMYLARLVRRLFSRNKPPSVIVLQPGFIQRSRE